MSDAAGLWPDDHTETSVAETSRAETSRPSDEGGPFSHGRAAVTVAILCLVTIVAFEAMALSAVMPEIAAELHAVRLYGLAFSALLTAQLVAIVLAGVWTERHGPAPGMMTGQVLLGAGSALCAIAPNFAVFLGGRIVAGFGGGLLVVMLYVVVGRIYPDRVRPKVFTAVSAAWIVPALLGPPVAAWITHQFGWRWVFWVLLPPIAATAAVVGWRSRSFRDELSALESPRDHAEHVRAAWAGLGIAVAAGVLQWGTTELHRRVTWHTFAASLGLLGILVIAPRLVPRGTWLLARGLPAVLGSRGLMTAAFFGALTYAPLMLVRERHLSLTRAGLMVSVGSIGWALGAFLQGLGRFHGRRWRLVAIGGGLLAFALALMGSVAWFGLPTWLFAISFLVGGTGMGLAVASQAVLALDHSPPEGHGQASSGLMLADVLGSVVGIAVAGAIFAALHSRSDTDAPVLGAIWWGLAVIAAFVVLGGRRIGSPATRAGDTPGG